MSSLWTYRVDPELASRLEGFDVDAADGHIGSIDEATYETDRSYIVVDTGVWIFGKKRLIPASAIREIDLSDSKVVLSLTKDQVKDAPDYRDAARDGVTQDEDSYWAAMDSYYGQWPLK